MVQGFGALVATRRDGCSARHIRRKNQRTGNRSNKTRPMVFRTVRGADRYCLICTKQACRLTDGQTKNGLDGPLSVSTVLV